MTLSTRIHKFHIIDICTSQNMPATLHTYVPLHCYCSLHTDSTLLHISVRKQQTVTCACHVIAIYVTTNIPFKGHIYAKCTNYLTGDEVVFQYICYISTGINPVARSSVHRWCRQHQWPQRSLTAWDELSIGQISQKVELWIKYLFIQGVKINYLWRGLVGAISLSWK